MQQEMFERDHPDLNLLADASDDDKELLTWAHNCRYIKLKKFGGKIYYTDYDLADAAMWKDKRS